MMRWLRRRAGHLLLALCRLAMRCHLGYLAWLAFRWSLIVMPVTEDERRAAVHWWDMNGYLWGFCRWPKPQESDARP